jgi:hypothetical protein
MLTGLRLILTTECNRHCDFCYQKNYNTTLNLNKLDIILKNLTFTPEYITIMGGEILFLKNYKDYIDIILKYYPNTPKSLITNGDFDLNYIKKSGIKITVSNNMNISADRYNLYYNGKNIINIPENVDLHKITICSELKNDPISPPILFNQVPIKISDGHYKYECGIHYFNHENEYNNNELIILPDSKMTLFFNDVLNFI